jgi:3-deoxy-D-manno-octulosonic-acid transferase
MLGNVDRLLMQSDADAERVRKLGRGTIAEERIAVIGNSKFDQDIARLTPAEVVALRESLKLPPEAPVFVAGSTRSAEEEAVLIDAYKTMQAQVPDLCLLVAPRQIPHAEELSVAMRAAGLILSARTELDSASALRPSISFSIRWANSPTSTPSLRSPLSATVFRPS